MKRALPSTIPRRLPPRPDCPVYVPPRSSGSFVSLESLRSSRHSSFCGQNRKKESRGADSSARPSSDITFIPFRVPARRSSLGLVSGRVSLERARILSSSSRFVSSRLYCRRVRDQNPGLILRGTYECTTVSFREVQFPDKNKPCTSPCAISANLVAAMNWKTRYVPRVDFQFAPYARKAYGNVAGTFAEIKTIVLAKSAQRLRRSSHSVETRSGFSPAGKLNARGERQCWQESNPLVAPAIIPLVPARSFSGEDPNVPGVTSALLNI